MVEPVAPSTTHTITLPPGHHALAYAILADESLAILATDHDIAGLWPDDMPAMNDVAKVAQATIFVTNGVQLHQGPSFPWKHPALPLTGAVMGLGLSPQREPPAPLMVA